MLISQIKSLSSVLPTSAYLDVLAVAERVLVRKFFTTPSGLGGSVAVKVGRSTAWSDLVMVDGPLVTVLLPPPPGPDDVPSNAEAEYDVSEVLGVRFPEDSPKDRAAWDSVMMGAAQGYNRAGGEVAVQRTAGTGTDWFIEVRQECYKRALGCAGMISGDVDGGKVGYVKGWSLRGLGRHGKAMKAIRKGIEETGEEEWRRRLEKMEGEERKRVERGRARDRGLAKRLGKLVKGVMEMGMKKGDGDKDEDEDEDEDEGGGFEG